MKICTIWLDMRLYTLSSPWVNDRSTNPNNTYFTVAAWTNVALQSHGSVCDENATTISSSNPCVKAFDGILISSSYWTTTNPGVGSWLKVRESGREDKHTRRRQSSPRYLGQHHDWRCPDFWWPPPDISIDGIDYVYMIGIFLPSLRENQGI